MLGPKRTNIIGRVPISKNIHVVAWVVPGKARVVSLSYERFENGRCRQTGPAVHLDARGLDDLVGMLRKAQRFVPLLDEQRKDDRG